MSMLLLLTPKHVDVVVPKKPSEGEQVIFKDRGQGRNDHGYGIFWGSV